MSGFERRLSRIFSDDGRTVIIAIDHGLFFGSIKGLIDFKTTVTQLLEGGADALQMSFAMTRFTKEPITKCGLIVRLDTTNLWRQKPKPQIALHNAVFNLKQAIKADADAVVVYLFIGGELERKSFSLVSDIINKAHDYDLPVIVEPMIEKGIGESIAEPTELINAARLAVEMGADILKVDYTGDQESFKELVKTSSVPVLLRGGPKRESQSLIDEMVKDAIKAGARGVVFGRNVWQTENVTERVKHLISLVHEKF